jgi:glycosyltransferase involved in cell wall biosynthesis
MAQDPLSILHFSTSDIEGGSARSAWRLHNGLTKLGHKSRMLVGQKQSGRKDVETVAPSPFYTRLDTYTNILLNKFGYQYAYVPSQHHMVKHRWAHNPDIIQLFNIHGGYFNPNTLLTLSKRAQIVWRLSDLWPLTGHCAYPGDCDKWQTGCGSCPSLDSYPSIGRDRSKKIWLNKQRIYEQIDLCIVAPSTWTQKAAQQSPFFANKIIHCIPNGINLSKYSPRSKEEARHALGLANDKFVIFFGAHVAFDNPRKGTDILLKALQNITEPEKVVLLVAGQQSDKWHGQVPFSVVSLGFIKEDEAILQANAAADFIVTPSVVENLPNTIIEALAMGKPIIAFDSGGIADAVQDGITGLLVKKREADQLTKAINTFLASPDTLAKMSQNSRQLAEKNFDEKIEAKRFSALYIDLLKTN